MQKIRLWYSSHRKKIWITVGIIAAVIVFVQLLNFFVSKVDKNDNEIPRLEEMEENTISEIKNETNIDLETTQSVITGESLPEKQLKEELSVIGNFFEFCNQKKLQEAYNLLSDECKSQMYNSLEIFEQTYYQDVFAGEKKIFSAENWIDNTYKVSITEDILATGKSNNGYSKQDYITVKETDEGYKLNINNYIGYEDINKTTEDEDNKIKVEVISKNTYMDRQEYTIRITNNNDTAVTIDGRTNAESLYLENNRGLDYPAYTHELTDPMLNIESGQTRELTIKFYCRYSSNMNIREMVFSDFIIYKGQGSKSVEVRAEV